MKKTLFMFTVLLMAVAFASCTLFSGKLGEKSGFTRYLAETEDNVRNDEWEKARTSRDKAFAAWHDIKPVMQLDIDHDYVNDVEDYLVSLEAYIETRSKAEALATLMLLRHTYENIGVY
jgi:uncharacterized protein YxeA